MTVTVHELAATIRALRGAPDLTERLVALEWEHGEELFDRALRLATATERAGAAADEHEAAALEGLRRSRPRSGANANANSQGCHRAEARTGRRRAFRLCLSLVGARAGQNAPAASPMALAPHIPILPPPTCAGSAGPSRHQFHKLPHHPLTDDRTMTP
jgi:hypothetical protein